MNRTRIRLAVASALTAAVALGGAAASADAAPRKPVKATTAKATVTKQARAAALAAKKLAAAKSTGLRQVAAKDAALVRADALVVRAALGAESTAAIRTNIAADRAYLATIKTRIFGATTLLDVNRAVAAAKVLRPQNYDQVRAIVALDNRTLAGATAQRDVIAEVSAAADAKEAEGADVTAVRQALAAATVLNDKAVADANAATAAALTVRATTDRKVDLALRNARTLASSAATALEEAEVKVAEAQAALEAATVPAEQPVTDPATTDPATTA
jgi:hypothetical protein